jgi:hypothetical protein
MSVPAVVPVVPVVPVHAPELGAGSELGATTEVEWAQGQGLAMPVGAGLTVDITSVPTFEAALRIVEFVRGLEAERDIKPCSSGGSAATTPGDSGLEKVLRLDGGQ